MSHPVDCPDRSLKVNRTTHDNYGLKAGGVLASLEKFETLFGLKLAHLLFGAAEETSKVLQEKIPLYKKLSQL